jgi:hypothetical protein
VLSLPACTLKGTTKAITDPTTDILSSSFRTWFTEDGYVKEEFKVLAFASFNYSNLKQDMARGSGEYLMSLGALLDIPASRRSDFASLVQERYSTLVASDRTTPKEMLAAVDSAIASHPDLKSAIVAN